MATSIQSGLKAALLGICINAALAIIKIAAGYFGNAYALIADGIESTADILSSLIVWVGLSIANKPADTDHPYGHGKAESIASLIVSLMLLGAAILIAEQSVKEIRTPHHAPKPFTLVVLLVVVPLKLWLGKKVESTGKDIGSNALQADALHHHSDALTSAAAFVGISIALIGGPGYESADDWGALAACGVIVWNALRLLKTAVDDIMDAAVPHETVRRVRETAAKVEGVRAIEKSRIRKVGLHLAVDIHVIVDGNMSVRDGHRIAHMVKDRLLTSQIGISDVTVHIEPDEAESTLPR